MVKNRFREIKQGKIKKPKLNKDKSSLKYIFAKKFDIIKAFLTDSFMLLMPIIYIVFYLVFSGRDGFADHRILGWIYILAPLAIVEIIFLFKAGQTPGMKAYNIKLLFLPTGQKPPLVIIILRQILSKFTFLFFGWIIWLFRKDKRNLHDLIINTALVYDKKHNS